MIQVVLQGFQLSGSVARDKVRFLLGICTILLYINSKYNRVKIVDIHTLKLYILFLIIVLPTTTHLPNSILKPLMHEQHELIPTHDWYQTEKHIVLSIYTKRKGMCTTLYYKLHKYNNLKLNFKF